MNIQLRLWIAVAIISTAASSVWAQQEVVPSTGDQRSPTTATGLQQPGPQGKPTAPELEPDKRPLSGVEELRVESPSGSRSFVIPSFRISAYGDTNQPIRATGANGAELTGSVAGGLSVQKVTRRNELQFDYMGGGLFYARNSELNATAHQMGFTNSYRGRRWGLTLGDHLGFLPESAFGFGGFGPSLGIGGAGNWNPIFSPDQTLFSGRGYRISNTGLAQIEYLASSRSSFTFSGAYSMLRFRESGYIESDSAFANAGYNYALTPRDSIAVIYGLNLIRFKGVDYHLDGHYGQLAYSRRITGRLAFQIAGGPQLVVARTPSTGVQNRVYWNAHSALQYALSRTSFGFSYTHYTSSGSGLLLGASTDYFQMSVSRRLTRNWSWSAEPGYSRNARLRQDPTSTGPLSYNSAYAHTSISRMLGRYADMFFDYTLQNQWSSAQSPTGVDSGSSFIRHLFGVGMSWHGRRITVD